MRVPSFHAFRAGRASAVAVALTNLWAWGSNYYGKLGLGNTTSRSSPVQVGTTSTWSSVEYNRGGTHTLATKTDGTLWAWGENLSGQLGLANTTARSSPVQVGALTTWSKVCCGLYNTAAIKTDGTLWTWGNNRGGQLGIGNIVYKSSPVQVGALTTWSKVSCGKAVTAAIKTDGTLWTWGDNNYGQLGLGNTTNRSSPVQVGTLTTWSKVHATGCHILAIKTDGTLWSWGANVYGQLGHGNFTNLSSPVQVGVLTTWSKISGAGGVYLSYYNYIQGNSAAITTGGTLWTWGYCGTYGILGRNNTQGASKPTQVGALTTWSKINLSGGGSQNAGPQMVRPCAAAIKTDGTLWTWGDNNQGTLGRGNVITPIRSPVQVGTATDWTSVSCGTLSLNAGGVGGSMFAIRTT